MTYFNGFRPSSFVVVRCASYVNNNLLNIYRFLETTRLIFFTFDIMQFGCKGNINRNFYEFCPKWALGAGQNGQNLTIFQNYQIVNFMSSGVGGSALERGQNSHIVLIHIMIKNFFTSVDTE